MNFFLPWLQSTRLGNALWVLAASLAGTAAALLLSACAAGPVEPVPHVRLAELKIDAARLQDFKVAATTHAAAATRLEPGILAFHAVAEKSDPTRIRVLEIYQSEAAYRAHLRSPHFEAFATATRDMVTDRRLFDATPVHIGSKTRLPVSPVVRVAELEVLPSQLGAYKAAVTEEIDESIRLEPGVAAIYALSLKDSPHRLRFFEIYADQASYRSHIASAHFRKYVDTTQSMIESRRLLETESLSLYIKS